MPAKILIKVLVLAAPLLQLASVVSGFPAHASLAGLSGRDYHYVVSQLEAKVPAPPPGPLDFNGTKLVDDPEHPWMPLQPGDVRGPCPGLNTLASHGVSYLPRNGVATPVQMIQAVQEGFNMENFLARFTTYSAMLLDGNLVTDLLSIGAKTSLTGRDPPLPALAGGMHNHGTFEGDASLTRGDAFFGDNHSFNETLFEQFKDFSNRFGNGFYNLTVAAELRFHRIQQGIATNPQFSIAGFRHLTAYAEVTFPANLFVDGRREGCMKGQLDMLSAERFFRDMRFPPGFFRPAKPTATEGIDAVLAAHPVQPGANDGTSVDSFTVDESLGSLLDYCGFYTQFVNTTIRGLYPNPTGVLRKNLDMNLQFFFDSLSPGSNCTQVFPYGQPGEGGMA
ncbi:Cloroperoxidase [Coprinopsis marcescibilis]|uniref:Cloroperoxidase n=1 Tax=Coprinopsis marcescibilis TaxID=230819 RepID=A0A5C3KL04_COPMA|nr:Cloroperoxidase [Coprinopsis marcescibilis]